MYFLRAWSLCTCNERQSEVWPCLKPRPKKGTGGGNLIKRPALAWSAGGLLAGCWRRSYEVRPGGTCGQSTAGNLQALPGYHASMYGGTSGQGASGVSALVLLWAVTDGDAAPASTRDGSAKENWDGTGGVSTARQRSVRSAQKEIETAGRRRQRPPYPCRTRLRVPDWGLLVAPRPWLERNCKFWNLEHFC